MIHIYHYYANWFQLEYQNGESDLVDMWYVQSIICILSSYGWVFIDHTGLFEIRAR